MFAAAYAGFATSGTNVVLLGLPFVAAGLAIGCVETAQHSAVAALAPVDLRGSAFGLLATIQAVGNLAVSGVAGILWTAMSPTVAFAYLAGWMLLALTGLAYDGRDRTSWRTSATPWAHAEPLPPPVRTRRRCQPVWWRPDAGQRSRSPKTRSNAREMLGNQRVPSRTRPDRSGTRPNETAAQRPDPDEPGPGRPNCVSLKIGRSAVRPRPWPPISAAQKPFSIEALR